MKSRKKFVAEMTEDNSPSSLRLREIRRATMRARNFYVLKLFLLILSFIGIYQYISYNNFPVKKFLFSLYALGYLHLSIAGCLIICLYFYRQLTARIAVLGITSGCLSAIIATIGRLFLLTVAGMFVIAIVLSILDITVQFSDWISRPGVKDDLIGIAGIVLTVVAFVYYAIRMVICHVKCGRIREELKKRDELNAWLEPIMEEAYEFQKALRHPSFWKLKRKMHHQDQKEAVAADTNPETLPEKE